MSNCDNICDKQLDDSQYKWSIYNVFIKESDNHGFIYNSNTGGICRVPSLLYHDARENRFSGIQKVEALYKGGFIVDKGLDEFNALLNQSFTTAENRDQADIDVTIAPSLSCNMRCSYCFEKGTRHLLDNSVMNKKTQDATINYILQLTDRISAKNLNVIWFGGEPLLQYPIVVEMSREIGRRLQPHVSLSTKLVTNGYLLSPEKIAELVKVCNLKCVQISIDGLQNTYARIRGVKKDRFERVVENIVLCSDAVKTLVRLNATPDNLDELYEFVAILVPRIENKSNLVFRLSEVLDYSNAQRTETTVFPTGTFRIAYRAFAKYLFGLGLESDCYFTESFVPMGCKYFLSDNVAIDPRGRLYKCEHHFGEPEHIIGDVFQGFYSTSRLAHIYSIEGIDNRCKCCELYPICKYASCSDYRRFLGPDPDKCLCHASQLESLVKDIADNLQYLKMMDCC